MTYKNGAMSIVTRGNKILMVRMYKGGKHFHAIPGGGIEEGETPEQAVIRELWEECSVHGEIIIKTCQYPNIRDTSKSIYVFHVDIGDQTPMLGANLAEYEKQALLEVKWMALDEMCERDRAFLWSNGLATIPQFFDELVSWGEDISYPSKG